MCVCVCVCVCVLWIFGYISGFQGKKVMHVFFPTIKVCFQVSPRWFPLVLSYNSIFGGRNSSKKLLTLLVPALGIGRLW